MPTKILPASTVRVATVRAIPLLLKELGADPALVLAEAGVDPALFDSPDNLISYLDRSRLISLCVARTGCAHFTLLLGQRTGIESLGLVGLLAKYSPNVEVALGHLVSAMHLHVRGASVGLTLDKKTAAVTYDIYQKNTQATDQIADGAMAITYNIVRSLCGREWRATEIRFSHRKPDQIAPYRKFFRAPLLFEQEHNAVVFDRKWLNSRLPGADEELQRLLQKQIDALAVRHDQQFPDQVRSVLRAALPSGQASAETVAGMFSMHTRTMSRRLQKSGTSFQALVDECRYEIARQMLRDTELEIVEIATSLAYADASAFIRAFKRWSGTTPARWRANLT